MSQPTGNPGNSFRQKRQQELRYREQLLDDLINQKLVYESGPYEAHIQFSNYCNMSCIMCWDGRNPPTEKASPELLAKINQQVAPHLSVITPYSGSEPLALTWDETRKMAIDNSILLCITTNCQFLDEARFLELKDITETLLLSIDSHIPDVLEIIRPGGNIQKVLKNLATTAKLCLEHQVECIVNVVLMTHNAPHLPETIDYLANLGIETVNIIQMLNVNGRSQFLDPLIHFSQDYIDWIKERCLKTAKSQQIRMIWSVAGCFEYDFRGASFVKPLERKSWNDEFDERMKRLFPGHCRYVFNRLRIDQHGDVAPCCYATQGELSLGNLLDQNFEEIWNGPSAQDLRRGMLCRDLPSQCSSCRFVDPVPPQTDMPFIRKFDESILGESSLGRQQIDVKLKCVDQKHAIRSSSAIDIEIVPPEHEIAEYRFALSFGGEESEVHCATLTSSLTDGGSLVFRIPDQLWNDLRTNVGYWWNVWAIPKEADKNIQRISTSAVLIRHQAIPRIENSTLNYPDQGSLPVIDLGTSKQLGFEVNNFPPIRPIVTSATLGSYQRDSDRLDSDQRELLKGSPATSATKQGMKQAADNLWQTIWQRITSFNKEFNPRRKTHPAIREGYLDQVTRGRDYLHVAGWLLTKSGPADRIEIVSREGKVVKGKPVTREDIELAFPQFELAAKSGFEAKLKASSFCDEDGYEFEILVYLADEIVCQIPVKWGQAQEQRFRAGKPYWLRGKGTG